MIGAQEERKSEEGRQAVLRFARLYQRVAAYALSTLLLLLACEGAARVATGLYYQQKGDARSGLAAYQKEPWGTAYWKEFGEAVAKPRYQEYVGWRSPQYRGQYVNIDRDGLRVTPGADCGDSSFSVFMFGGSTMWGVGAPDDMTIPAYVQKSLAQLRSPQPICVRNFGVVSGVSTQGVVSLEEELRHGHVPDLVVFYDGANDVMAAFQADRAGGVMYSAFHRDQYEERIPLAYKLNKASAIFHIAASLTKKLRGQTFDWTYETPGSYSKELAADVTKVYLENVKIVQALGKAYHFAAHFYWQPIVTLGRKALTPDEIAFRNGLDRKLVDLNADAYALIGEAAKTMQDLHSITDVLDEVSQQVYIDYVHLTPYGNSLVAKKMLEPISR